MRRSRRSPDLRKRLFLLLLAFLAAACRPAPEEDLSAVFGPGERLRFDHLCAEEFDHAASVWVIFADEDAGGLALAVRSTRSGEEVVLRGPEAYDFAPATGNAAPSVRVLGLLDVLNPEQEGGLVHTITEGRTFDRCIGIREGLIRKFERDAEAGKFDGADW